MENGLNLNHAAASHLHAKGRSLSQQISTHNMSLCQVNISPFSWQLGPKNQTTCLDSHDLCIGETLPNVFWNLRRKTA